MIEGVENIFHLEDGIDIFFRENAAKTIRELAVLSGIDATEVVVRAVGNYAHLQELSRQGCEGPYMIRSKELEGLRKLLAKIGLYSESEAVKIDLDFGDRPEVG